MITVNEAIALYERLDLNAVRQMQHNVIDVQLDTGQVVKMMESSLYVHAIFWKTLRKNKAPVDEQQTYQVFPVTSNMVAKVISKQYAYLLKLFPKRNHKPFVYDLWSSIHELYTFCYVYLGDYICSIDLEDFLDIIYSDELKHITLTDIPTENGTEMFEREYAERTKILQKILSTPGAMKHNPIIHYMQAGVFNVGQLMQMLVALGSRDDVDGTLLPHMMNCSGMSGMRSLKDLCTEAASPKKTTFYNTSSIGDTQSFNKSMQLLTVNLVHVYKGDCGSRNYIPVIIEKGKGPNYVDKIIVLDDGTKVAVTYENCRLFEEKEIRLISPIGCRYVDGVCEHCAGRATESPWAYLPDVRIGSYAATVIFSEVSQKLLSAKHLIKTFTIAMLLNETSRRYLVKHPQHKLMLSSRVIEEPKRWVLTVPTKYVGHPNDLIYDGVTPAGFGRFPRIGLKNLETGEGEEFDIMAPDMQHHFTLAFLNHIKKVRDRVTIKDGNYEIPLAGFNIKKQAVIDTIAKNDDIVAYFKRVKKLFDSGLVGYPNIAMAFSSIAEELYKKVDTNIFFVELIVKAILNSVLAADGSIQIKTLKQTISDNNIATKLGHSHVRNWVFSTDPSVGAKQPSPFDALFGFSN